ncbi:hypothetical protein ACIQWB_37750 [Streptomyces olivaceus]|uniref:hypothetical protein n=1 Tax=Streptomyces olivaceus TaxID=47716 RepID=UPI0037F79424
MNHFKYEDGRIMATDQPGGLTFTPEEQAEAVANDYVLNLSNEDRAVSAMPERGDHIGRQYRTVGGHIVTAATTAGDEISYWYCQGCKKRDEVGYGWSDVARERAEAHAAQCRAV